MMGFSNIGEITQGATTFEGREVKLRGTASQLLKIPLTETKGYRLKDATVEIVVWTTGIMPGDGEEVTVRDRVENAIIFAGQSYGLALKEIERQPPGIKWPWKGENAHIRCTSVWYCDVQLPHATRLGSAGMGCTRIQ